MSILAIDARLLVRVPVGRRQILAHREATGFDPDLRQQGYLLLAGSEATRARLLRDVALQNRLGLPTEFLEPAEIARRFPEIETGDPPHPEALPLTPSQMRRSLGAVIASAFAASLTFSVCMPLLALILTTVGIPAEGIALILGVDRILDMSRTVPNVMGDQLTALIIARSEGVSLRGARAP